MCRIPIRPVELEIRMAELFWGSWVDQPVRFISRGFTEARTLQYKRTLHFNVKSMAIHIILDDTKLQLLILYNEAVTKNGV